MTVELPATLNTGREQILELSVDVAGLFAGRLAEEATSTHSRAGDALASTLRANVEKAFSVQDVDGHIAASGLVQGRGERRVAVATARDAHPYRFTLSSNFPIPDLPRDNPLTEEGVELGRRLFSERLLSVNDSQSCASCHQANAGFSDAGKAVSVGAEGREGTRNAMPIFNLAWKNSFFWDGRAATLREQVLMPVQNPVEMHANLGQVVGKLNQAKDYPALFEKAFGARAINAELIARALEQFALTQISCDSKFDRAMAGTEKLSDEEQRGFELFFTEYDPRIGMHGADCFHCHGGPFFTTHGFANTGLDSQFTDLGRYAVTTNDWDRGKFAVPSLRNVELTGPYMHDGRFKTLEEVVDHYCTGMKRSGSLDPNLAKHPDGGVPLSADEKKALVAFLKTLTDESLKPVARTEVAQNDTR
jgi:cytochrome c peroxidase